MNVRVGYGYDLHKLAPGRVCIIGGVKIPHEKGLLGHSDADVLLHAITDALLGSLALGDIGIHFPDTDPKWKGAESSELLRKSYAMVTGRGWEVQNIDSTVIAEQPKLKPYIEDIRNSIASILDIGPDRVSVKATTSEQLGFLGRGDGIAAHSTVLIKSGA